MAEQEASVEAIKEALWQEAYKEYPIVDGESDDDAFDRYNEWRAMYASWYNAHTVAYGREVKRSEMLQDIASHINMGTAPWRWGGMYKMLESHLVRFYGAHSERMRRWYTHMRMESLHWQSVRQGDVQRSISRAIIGDMLSNYNGIERHQL